MGDLKIMNLTRMPFLSEIKQYPAEKPVNWTRLAGKYSITYQGNQPKNSGQILMSFAKHHGINTNRFNRSMRVSGRDYTRRVRRSKMKLGKSRISIPSARSAKKSRTSLKPNYSKITCILESASPQKSILPIKLTRMAS